MSHARLLVGLAGLALGATSIAGGLSGQASAAGATTDGSDWGPSGTLASDSTVVARWDNANNVASSVVYRDGRQAIPHTGGKTYDDVDAAVASSYADYFGPDNGFGGLEVKVSQTKQLVNQAVTIEISGSKGGAVPGSPVSDAYFQVFQCWGGLTAAGSPDLSATQPDPATCQVGAVGSDSSGEVGEKRTVGLDQLSLGGDWASTYGTVGVPFTPISGEGAGPSANYFTSTTTNELSNVVIDTTGTADRTFEIQTGAEAPGLGCGFRADTPSTRACWLVVVPRISNVLRSSGAISPTLWAQRLQFKLEFRDVATACPGGKARALVGGSELVADAASSWIPGVCGAESVSLGYTKIGDEVARAQFDGGSSSAILTTKPLGSSATSVAVPMALTAPVFAFAITYQPKCRADSTSTEQSAQDCGYDSLADMQEDTTRAGTPVTNLRLNARLVAKLLTQSYATTYLRPNSGTAPAWMLRDRAPGLLQDPEFTRLNPDLVHQSPSTNINHLILEGLRSDAASAVWDWILADQDARSFLAGCPDADGMIVNPFYSTRTYDDCLGSQTTLAAQADADRAATESPSSYVDGPLSYPPDGSPYPLPGWQEELNNDRAPLTVFDQFPRVDAMSIGARNVAIGYQPANNDWCATALDSTCQPQPGKWRDTKQRQKASELGLMAVVDAAGAARFQLATAKLCDTDGSHCVGADSSSVTKAAARFVSTERDGMVKAGTTDYASGAYPLAVPVYAVISTTLDASDRAAYATALDYIVTTGQRPGFGVGALPPGFAPLTSDLVGVAKAQLASLRGPATSPPTETLGGKKDTVKSSSESLPPGSVTPPPAETAPPAGAPEEQPQAAPEMIPVSAGTESWWGSTMPLLLGLALVTGVVGPILSLRGRVRLVRSR